MSLGLAIKDPAAALPWRIDWSAWLAGIGVITNSTWTVPTAITKSTEAIENDTTTAVVLAGGVAGNSYTIANQIVTSDGRIDERSFTLRVIER